MALRIDKFGRVVVPKDFRDRLGMNPEAETEAIEQAHGVLLRTVNRQSAPVKIDGAWLQQGTAEPGAKWDRFIDDIREERVQSAAKG